MDKVATKQNKKTTIFSAKNKIKYFWAQFHKIFITNHHLILNHHGPLLSQIFLMFTLGLTLSEVMAKHKKLEEEEAEKVELNAADADLEVSKMLTLSFLKAL